MKHAEIHSPDRQTNAKFVVLTSDSWNSSGQDPVIAHIIRSHGAGNDLVIELSEFDPVSGVVLTPWPESIPANEPTELLGMLTGATMARLKDALRLLYDL